MSPDDVPVIFHAAGRISHRMSVFAHHDRTIDMRIERHFFEFLVGRVHAADDIDESRIVGIGSTGRFFGRRSAVCDLCAGEYCGRTAFQRDVKRRHRLSLRPFVMDIARGIVIFDPSGHGGKVGTGPRLVAQRPENDRRMVPVADHHPGDTIQERSGPRSVVGELTA